MLRRLIGVALSLSLLYGVQSKLASSSSCVTPQGTLCRTISWEYSSWENQSWGIHAVARRTGRVTLAFRSDGARFERFTGRSFRNYLIPNEVWDKAKIVLVRENQTIEMDDSRREYQVLPFVEGGATVWNPDDVDCSRFAKALSLSELARTDESFIAGFRVIEYAGLRSASRRETVSLAPSLGCLQMKVVQTDHNSFGVPTAFSESEVVLVKLGEPEEALFAVPKNFRLK